MRRLVLLAVCALAVAPLTAQNTDIESLAGLQFNFANPGARSLGMGGAFLGLADDASAAEANPAGLTILRKPEISIEARNHQDEQIFTTSGTFPDLQRTAYTHYSNRAELSFASFVYPFRKLTIGAYYHEPLRSRGGGAVMPTFNEFFGTLETTVPDFYLPKGGTPVSKSECESIRNQKGDPFACLHYGLLPFVSALDVRERTLGAAAAYKFGDVSVGATVRYQRFREQALTVRFFQDPVLTGPIVGFHSFAVQATSDIRLRGDKVKEKHDVTFAGGVKWTMSDRVSLGASYKQGAKFIAPTFGANANTGFEFVKTGDTTFHIPDVYGVGISVRPISVLTINADAVRVTYSNLVDQFISINENIRAIDKAYKADDVIEIRLGAEYFFGTKIPLAIRAGAWRDPAHSIEFRGPLREPDAVAAAVLYPKGKASNHFSIGGGLAWPRLQIDVAYDQAPHYRVGSLSAITRY